MRLHCQCGSGKYSCWIYTADNQPLTRACQDCQTAELSKHLYCTLLGDTKPLVCDFKELQACHNKMKEEG